MIYLFRKNKINSPKYYSLIFLQWDEPHGETRLYNNRWLIFFFFSKIDEIITGFDKADVDRCEFSVRFYFDVTFDVSHRLYGCLSQFSLINTDVIMWTQEVKGLQLLEGG